MKWVTWVCLWRVYLGPDTFLCLLFDCWPLWNEKPLSQVPAAMIFCLGPVKLGLKSWGKINLSFLQLFFLGIWHSEKTSINTATIHSLIPWRMGLVWTPFSFEGSKLFLLVVVPPDLYLFIYPTTISFHFTELSHIICVCLFTWLPLTKGASLLTHEWTDWVHL
jgi:hypothetical protein